MPITNFSYIFKNFIKKSIHKIIIKEEQTINISKYNKHIGILLKTIKNKKKYLKTHTSKASYSLHIFPNYIYMFIYFLCKKILKDFSFIFIYI